MTSILSFKEVNKIFSGPVDVKALENITIELEKGCFAALVGVSGSGKTTFLNLASGLDLPTKGVVTVGGKNIGSLSAKQLSLFRRESLGFVFQSYNLFSTLTVIENIEYTMVISGRDQKEARLRALHCLDLVGLTGKDEFFPQKLSGGQQQRVAVARAIASQPEIIFADEPTANLDHDTSSQLIQLFRKLNQEFGTSFLFSTHDSSLMDSVDTVIKLKSGKITDVEKVNPAK